MYFFTKDVHYIKLEITQNIHITNSFATGNILDYFLNIFNMLLQANKQKQLKSHSVYANLTPEHEAFQIKMYHDCFLSSSVCMSKAILFILERKLEGGIF